MLESKIQLRAALPSLGKYTVSEDFASILIKEIFARRPRTIVEAGSGVSTLLAGYCLERLGRGSLRCFEHLSEYENETNNLIRQHGLEAIDIKIISSPLCTYNISGENFTWYSLDNFDIATEIDMVIVDGPPRSTGKLARYPIFPLLFEQFSPSAIILLDDVKRQDETEIVKRWLREYPNFQLKLLNTEKGAALFYKL
jgi:hypothetical protein